MNWKNLKRRINQVLYKLTHNSFFYWDGCPYNFILAARKDFIMPDINFYTFKEGSDFYKSDMLTDSNNHILVRELMWKTKYGDYRFEWCPMIQLKFFGRYFIWLFEAPGNKDNLDYYESILNYLYRDGNDINLTIKNYCWKTYKDGKWVPKEFNTDWLTSYGYNKRYKEKFRNEFKKLYKKSQFR